MQCFDQIVEVTFYIVFCNYNMPLLYFPQNEGHGYLQDVDQRPRLPNDMLKLVF